MITDKRNELSFWHFQIAGWVLLEIMSLSRNLFYMNYLGSGEIDYAQVVKTFSYYVFCDIVAMLITVVMRYAYRPFYATNPPLRNTVVMILSVSLVASVVSNTFDYFVGMAFPVEKHMASKGLYSIIYSTFLNVMIFVSWSILYFAIKYWRQYQYEKGRAEKAAYMAQTAQLQMLRYQLNPHFLFNSLNSISALIDEDRKASKEMVRELADFLRYSLVSRNFSVVPLREELEAIRLYLSIEKKRFEDKLEILYQVDPEVTEFPVLSFILHPLVENAVKYGMKTSPLPLKVTVSAVIRHEKLMLMVENSGTWVEPSDADESKSTGVGLKNVRQRLSNTFPGRASLETRAEAGRVVAVITIDTPDHGITIV